MNLFHRVGATLAGALLTVFADKATSRIALLLTRIRKPFSPAEGLVLDYSEGKHKEVHLNKKVIKCLDASNATIEYLNLEGAQIYRADLCGASISHLNMQHAVIHLLDISLTLERHSKIDLLNASKAVIQILDLHGAEIGTLDLTGADVFDVDLSFAKIHKLVGEASLRRKYSVIDQHKAEIEQAEK